MLEIRGAILEIKPVRQVSERFSVQLIYIDTSTYNNYTGERYDNIALIQNINNKVNIQGLAVGHLITCSCYLNGRMYNKQDGSKGFTQNITLSSWEYVQNRLGEVITIPKEQLIDISGL